MALPFIPPKTVNKMALLGISESYVMDTFNHGEAIVLPSGLKACIKKYGNYEIGVGYTQNEKGQYVIIAVWKRERR